MTSVVHKSRIIAAGVVAALMIALVGSLAAQSAHATTLPTVDWQIAMKASSAFPHATGSAQYQSQPGQRELQIEVDHVAKLAGQNVSFYANGVKFGAAKVSSAGIVQIDRNTELGQSVPWIVHGSTVAARTSTGVPIADGHF
jgi:predicted PilT family ATPase